MAALGDDLQSRASVRRFASSQRAADIANSWMNHGCCFAPCAQARLRGADPAALQDQFVEVKASRDDCVIVQVNTFSHAEFQRIPHFTCKLCSAKFRATPANFGCSQGSHGYATNGTTQVFTNELLDSVLPMLRRGLSFQGTWVHFSSRCICRCRYVSENEECVRNLDLPYVRFFIML